MVKKDYTETFASKVQDIRLDGPDINTSILELLDNSIDWGKGNCINIIFDENDETLEIKDNGQNGFGSVESLERFFKLGETNNDVTTGTIGKYGKGGYKSIINISKKVEITSYFDGKKFTIGTNFTEMINNNSYTPNIKLKIEDNTEEIIGSCFKLHIRAEYVDKFSTGNLTRYIKRAYHNFAIDFKINDISFNTSEYKLFGDFISNTKYSIFYNTDNNEFSAIKGTPDNSEDNEIKIFVGQLECYVLKDIITNVELLGNLPGIDFYRNNRLCNARNPIRNIGEMSRNLDRGMMRGMRCHMVFKYNNVQLSDIKDVDSLLGLNTTKEICEDENKFSKSLRKLLENKAKECNKAYENHIITTKQKLEQYLSREITKFSQMDENTLLGLDIEKCYEKYKSFNEFKTWYLDENMEYKYCNSKADVKQQEKNDNANKLRKNSPIIVNYVIPIVKKIEDLVGLKKRLIMKNEAIETYKAEFGFTEEDSVKYLDERLNLESLKRVINEQEEKCNYDLAISKCEEIIELVNESDFKSELETYNKYAVEERNSIQNKKKEKEVNDEIITMFDEKYNSADELFKEGKYEESKAGFIDLIDTANTLNNSQDVLDNETIIGQHAAIVVGAAANKINEIDSITEKKVKVEKAKEHLNKLTQQEETLDRKEKEQIKKINEEILQFINNSDIKDELNDYKVTAQNKIKDLKPKKVKKKIDISKYLNMDFNEINEGDWEIIKTFLKNK